MTHSQKDILSDIELKKMPFSVPEGYFESFNVKIGEQESAAEETCVEKAGAEFWRGTVFRRLSPYLAMAAMFAIIVAAGMGLLKMVTPQDNLQDYGEFAYVDIIPLTDEDALYSYNSDYTALTEEDLIEYFIYEDFDPQTFNEE